MIQTIDVTGLSPEAIQTVESLVELLRETQGKSPFRIDVCLVLQLFKTGREILNLVDGAPGFTQ